MCKTFKYRLYPTKGQVQILAYCLTTCRYLYNELLEDRKNAYDRCGVGLNYIEQLGQLKYSNLGIYSQVPPDVLRRLDKVFQNFFRHVKNGEKKAGYTRFQGKNRYYNFTYPQTGFKIKDSKLHLSKIGVIRIFQPYDDRCETGTWERSSQTSTSRTYDLDRCCEVDFSGTLQNDGNATGEIIGTGFDGTWKNV